MSSTNACGSSKRVPGSRPATRRNSLSPWTRPSIHRAQTSWPPRLPPISTLATPVLFRLRRGYWHALRSHVPLRLRVEERRFYVEGANFRPKEREPRAAVSPRRAAGRHADDACGRVTASLDGGLDWTSALCPQGQSCLIGDWAILELVHGCTGDIHTCPDLPPVGSRRPDRPRSPDASLVGREPR